jgi:hypothetical protein
MTAVCPRRDQPRLKAAALIRIMMKTGRATPMAHCPCQSRQGVASCTYNAALLTRLTDVDRKSFAKVSKNVG